MPAVIKGTLSKLFSLKKSSLASSKRCLTKNGSWLEVGFVILRPQSQVQRQEGSLQRDIDGPGPKPDVSADNKYTSCTPLRAGVMRIAERG